MTRIHPRRAFLIGADPRWVEAASAAAAVGWGALALVVPDALANQTGYAPLGLFIPGALLGVVVLACGLGQAVVVLLDHQLARIPFAAATGSVWLLVAFAIAGAVGWSPTVPVLATFGAFDAAAMVVLIHIHHRQTGR